MPSPDELEGQLELARMYVARGWRPFPVEYRGKKPAVIVGKWGTNTASPAPDKMLVRWFTSGPVNVGIAAKGSGLVIIDEDREGAFERLAADYGQVVPETYRVRTAKGWHYYFEAPEGYPIGNAPGVLADYGIDVRGGGDGDGGYVVAAGSVHPSEHVYTADDPDADEVPMPWWLVELLLQRPEAPSAPISAEPDDLDLLGDDDRRFTRAEALTHIRTYATEPLADAQPGHRNRMLNQAAILVGHFTGTLETSLLAPGVARERLHQLGQAVGLEVAEVHATVRSGLKAGMAHPYVIIPDGQRQPTDPDSSSWKPADLGAIWDGTAKRREASVMVRDDGHGAFYPGLVHSVHGESETGKSWVAQWAAIEELERGGNVLYVDFESAAEDVLPRLRLLGLEREWLERLVYVSPDGPGDVVFASLLEQSYGVAVIDGVTASLAAYAAKSNGQDEVTEWHGKLPARIARETGAAVIEVDHVTKSTDGRGRFAVGSQAKMANLTGSAFYAELVSALRPGDVGVIALYVAKDRPGDVRANSGPMKASRLQPWGRFELDGRQHDRVTVAITRLEPNAEPDAIDVPDFASQRGLSWVEFVIPEKLVDNFVPDVKGGLSGAAMAQDIMRILLRDVERSKTDISGMLEEKDWKIKGRQGTQRGMFSGALALLERSKYVELTGSKYALTEDTRAILEEANRPR